MRAADALQVLICVQAERSAPRGIDNGMTVILDLLADKLRAGAEAASLSTGPITTPLRFALTDLINVC